MRDNFNRNGKSPKVVRLTYDEEFDAFDSLPSDLRKTLANAALKYSAKQIKEEFVEKGVPVNIISSIIKGNDWLWTKETPEYKIHGVGKL